MRYVDFLICSTLEISYAYCTNGLDPIASAQRDRLWHATIYILAVLYEFVKTP